jgi:hypothetical protein
MGGRELRGMFESRHSGSDGPKERSRSGLHDSPPAAARKVQEAQKSPDRPDPVRGLGRMAKMSVGEAKPVRRGARNAAQKFTTFRNFMNLVSDACNKGGEGGGGEGGVRCEGRFSVSPFPWHVRGAPALGETAPHSPGRAQPQVTAVCAGGARV